MPPKEEGQVSDAVAPAPETKDAPSPIEPNTPEQLDVAPEAANQDSFEETPTVEQSPGVPMSEEAFDERFKAFGECYTERQEAELSRMEPGLMESARSRIESFGNWYNKSLTPKQKLAVGIGLGALGAGAAALGLATGIAGGVIGTVMMARRIAGAAGTYAMLEAGMAKAYEKRGIERKDWQKKLGTAGALTLSALIGGGAVSVAAHHVAEFIHGVDLGDVAEGSGSGGGGGLVVPAESSLAHEAAGGAPELSSIEGEALTTEGLPMVELEGVHEVHTGDNITKIIQSKLLDGEEFKGLTAGQRENITANLIARMKADPASFGIASGNVEVLNIGDKLDLTKVGSILEGAEINGESLLAHAQNLGAPPEALFAGAPNVLEPQMETMAVNIPEPHVDIEVEESPIAEPSGRSRIVAAELPPDDYVSGANTPENALAGAEQPAREVSHEVAQSAGEPVSAQEVAASAEPEKLSPQELKYYGKEVQFYMEAEPMTPNMAIEGERTIDAFVHKNAHYQILGERGGAYRFPNIPEGKTFEDIMHQRTEHTSDGRQILGREQFSPEKEQFIAENLKTLMREHPQAFGLPSGDLNNLPPGSTTSSNRLEHFINALDRVYEKKASMKGFLSGMVSALGNRRIRL